MVAVSRRLGSRGYLPDGRIHVKVRAGSSGPSQQQQHEPFAKLRRQLFRTALEQVNQSLPEVWEISRTLFQSLDLKSRVVTNTAERNSHLYFSR